MDDGTSWSMWIAGAAGIAAIIAFWERIKGFISRISSIFVVHAKCSNEAGRAICLYCWTNLRRTPFGHRKYDGVREYVRPLRRNQAVGFECVGYTALIFWKGWRPIVVGRAAHSENQSDDWDDVSITFLRGTWDIDELLVTAMDEYNKRREHGTRTHRFYIRRFVGKGSVHARSSLLAAGQPSQGTAEPPSAEDITLGDKRLLKWQPDELGVDSGVQGRAFDGLAFPEHVQVVVEEARRWLKSANWYRERQIPWRRGWLLYGGPGTGKSSLVRALGQELDMPVFIYDLGSMSNEELLRYWHRLLGSVPCIALFEDADTVFDGRQNTLGEMGGGLTFDCFLNCLSGVEGCEGVFSILTTNRVEKLDIALGSPRNQDNGTEISTRPGRIDRAIELGLIDEKGRWFLTARILGSEHAAAENLVAEGDGDTPAQFVERCTQVALGDYWKGKSDG